MNFRKLPFLLVLCLTVLYSCTEEPDTLPQPQEPGLSNQDVNDFKRNSLQENFAKSFATALQDVELRKFLKQEALKKFDGDYDILYGKIAKEPIGNKTLEEKIAEAMDNRRTKSERAQQVSNTLNANPLLNISIPVNIEEWNTENFTPLVVFLPDNYDDQKTRFVKAYDAEGKITWLDANNAPDVPVVVIGTNERLKKKEQFSPNYIEPCMQSNGPAYSYKGNDYYLSYCGDGGGTGGGGTGGDTSCRPSKGTEYFKGVKFADVQQYEDWTLGAPEIVLQVKNPKDDGIMYKGKHEPSKRSDSNGQWWYFTTDLYYWDPSTDSDAMGFHFYEEDGGNSQIKVEHTIKFKFKGIEQSTKISFTLQNKDDEIGYKRVAHEQCLDAYTIGSGIYEFKWKLRNY
jgi:hypothetical protein